MHRKRQLEYVATCGQWLALVRMTGAMHTGMHVNTCIHVLFNVLKNVYNENFLIVGRTILPLLPENYIRYYCNEGHGPMTEELASSHQGGPLL